MERKTIRAILADETLDESGKVGKLLAAFHDEVADVKGTLKTDDDVKKAVDTAVTEALKNAPQATKVEESEAYKNLQAEYDTYKYTTEIKGKLKGVKAKDKFMDDIIGKIKKDDDFDKQITTLKEQYGEYFDADDAQDAQAPQNPPKPIFGTDQQHGGGDKQTPEAIELAKARSQW